MLTPEATVERIRQRCDAVVDNGISALQEHLTTEGEGDCEDARALLTRAVSAANALRYHLDRFYEFGGGSGAELKEQPCLD